MLKKDRKFSTGILLSYNLIFAVIAIIFFFILPNLFNYPPDSLYNDFQKQVNFNLYYSHQYIIVLALTLVLANVFLKPTLEKIDKLVENVNAGKSNYEAELRNKCVSYPYYIYFLQITMPTVALIIILGFFMKLSYILIFKIMILIFSATTLIAIFTYIFCKGMFKKVLIDTSKENVISGIRLGIKNKILFQVLPLLWISILFICLLGYSRLTREKGDLLYEVYKLELSEQNFSELKVINEENIIEKLKNINYQSSDDQYFIIKPDGTIVTDGPELSDFFVLYTLQKAESQNMHTYDNYGVDSQGTIEYIETAEGRWIVGVRYNAYSKDTLFYFFITLILLSLMSIFILRYFSKDIANDICEVSVYLEKIAEQSQIDYDRKLPITSNDEIGDLTVAFNKILDLEKNNIKVMSRNQEILVEQERLSSLGQLIGGIAHNLKTPIMSISGALEGIEDLIKEYDESIEDPQVNHQDHHQIAKEMNEWIQKIRPYLSYMTEVIDAVKGQAVSMNASTVGEFSAKELIARTQILMKNELKRRHCNLNLELNISEETQIKGEISAIVQVMDNLIINAMDAYNSNGGDIEVRVNEDSDKVYIEVSDNAGGISESVKDKLFKEMITSKGKNGTGLGLYMCYSTIKGKFDGDMYYESEEGKGTTFYITLNKLKQ